MRSMLGAAAAVVLGVSAAHAQPEVAITIDDLPIIRHAGQAATQADAPRAAEITRVLLKAFRARHVPVTGFVNQQTAEQIGLAPAEHILESWTAQGLDLGNHTYAHDDANAMSAVEFEQEITRGEPLIDRILAKHGRRPRFLRFPFNHTGDTPDKRAAIATFMADHGYRLAPCTIEGEDFAFNRAYEVALARHDKSTAARIRQTYVAYTSIKIDWYAKLDAEVLGREAPHVMLLHASPLNRDTIGEILTLFERRGYRFVSLEQATNDPAYATPEVATRFGPMWGYRWARALHVKARGDDEQEMPAWVAEYAKQGAGG